MQVGHEKISLYSHTYPYFCMLQTFCSRIISENILEFIYQEVAKLDRQIRYYFVLWILALYFIIGTQDIIFYLLSLCYDVFESIDYYFYNMTDSFGLVFGYRTIEKCVLKNNSKINNWWKPFFDNHKTSISYR